MKKRILLGLAIMILLTACMGSAILGAEHFYPGGKDAPAWLNRLLASSFLFYIFGMFFYIKEIFFSSEKEP